MTPVRWWCLIVAMSFGIILLDLLTGPYVLFPIAFVLPVCLAAWFLGSGAGIALAVVLPFCRLSLVVGLEHPDLPFWSLVLNSVIRSIVLIGLAMLATTARKSQKLARRVQVLEGILPICSFCKKIRLPDGKWQQIETYISHRSAAMFSHGFCEECGREHYGEYFRPSDPEAGKR